MSRLHSLTQEYYIYVTWTKSTITVDQEYYYGKNYGPVTLLKAECTSAQLTVFKACINQRVKGHLLFRAQSVQDGSKKKVQFGKKGKLALLAAVL